MSGSDWANAMTRSMLGVSLDVDGQGRWSIVKTAREPVRVGDRAPDMPLFDGAGGRVYLHDLCDDSFVALYFTDVRRRPTLPPDDLPGLRHYVVSRWDAPLDSGLRDRALLDVGNRVRDRFGGADDIVVLLRPDDHVAAILPIAPGAVRNLYERIRGLA